MSEGREDLEQKLRAVPPSLVLRELARTEIEAGMTTQPDYPALTDAVLKAGYHIFTESDEAGACTGQGCLLCERDALRAEVERLTIEHDKVAPKDFARSTARMLAKLDDEDKAAFNECIFMARGSREGTDALKAKNESLTALLGFAQKVTDAQEI